MQIKVDNTQPGVVEELLHHSKAEFKSNQESSIVNGTSACRAPAFLATERNREGRRGAH